MSNSTISPVDTFTAFLLSLSFKKMLFAALLAAFVNSLKQYNLYTKKSNKQFIAILIKIKTTLSDGFLFDYLPKAFNPANIAFLPKLSSIRNSSLYLATLSVRQSDPVFI